MKEEFNWPLASKILAVMCFVWVITFLYHGVSK
jgi:hypothetical protein